MTKTWILRPGRTGENNPIIRLEALADSGSSVSILSHDLAERINDNMKIRRGGMARLQEASGNVMDVSGRGTLVVQEKHGFPHKI